MYLYCYWTDDTGMMVLALALMVMILAQYYLIWHLTFDIWHLTFVICHLTYDICHLTFDIWHLTFDIWHLTFDIWHLTFDIWHEMILSNDIDTIPIHSLMESVVISAIWVWSVTDRLSRNMSLRDASASKKLWAEMPWIITNRGRGGEGGKQSFSNYQETLCSSMLLAVQTQLTQICTFDISYWRPKNIHEDEIRKGVKNLFWRIRPKMGYFSLL